MQDQAESAQESLTLAPSPQQQAVQKTQEALAKAQERALDFVRQNPVPCMVGGLVAGYLLGRLARSRWLRPRS